MMNNSNIGVSVTTINGNNSSKATDEPNHMEETALAIPRFIIDIAGLLANGLLLTACYRHLKAKSSAFGILIVQLVTGWLLYCGVYDLISDMARVLFVFYGYRQDYNYCVPMATIGALAISFLNWTEAFLAINRAVAICFPLRYTSMSSRKVIWSMEAFVCLVAICSALSPATSLGGRYVMANRFQCGYFPTSLYGRIFWLYVPTVPFGIAGVCCLAVLSRIMHMRWRDGLRQNGVASRESGPRRTPMGERRMKLAMMLLTQYLFGILCDLPAGIIMMNVSVRRAVGSSPLLIGMVNVIYSLQFTVSPLIFIALNTEYRQIIESMAFCQRMKRAGDAFHGWHRGSSH